MDPFDLSAALGALPLLDPFGLATAAIHASPLDAMAQESALQQLHQIGGVIQVTPEQQAIRDFISSFLSSM